MTKQYFKHLDLEYSTKVGIVERIINNEGLTVTDVSSCDGLRDLTIEDIDIDYVKCFISKNLELVVEFNDESFLINLLSISDILDTYEYDFKI
jgi:hypothetical protein|tara:strand:- start:1106 stop:1384 length:279 start_codon:yes stop_codon:yes gene_type:complete